MDVMRIVGAIVAINVGVIIIASLLLPTLSDVTAEGQPGAEYASLLGVIAIMAILAIVMMAVRLMGGRQ